VTPYGVSKVKVEAALEQLADADFSPTYLRASTAYGLSPLIRFDLVINNLTAWALTTGLVYLKSDGTPWRPVVHVADIALAYVAALHAPREAVHNEAFNVGTTTENYQIRELAEIVRDIVPNCRIEFAPDAGPDTRCYRVDCNKIARVLHEFKPQWTARRGVEELYESYRKVGLTLEEFEGERYKRIAHVKKLVDEGRLDHELRWRRPAAG
jgi:nucleoside-diphosphate-sugar epimerase